MQQLISSYDALHSSLITGLAGMVGVGKTALALVVADRLKEKFSNAQIYLDLKGTSATPLTPAEVMKYVIHAFEPTADLRQSSDEELAAIYRSVLNDKRALLLMDNAFDAAQVKPLVPPTSCAFIVTSRRYFVLAGLTPMRLDVMSEKDAREFLLKLCPRLSPSPAGEGRGEGVADEIARLCGRLPLALQIAGSALQEHSDWSPASYAARLSKRQKGGLGLLKKENDPELNVEAAFAESYDLLNETEQARWRVLAVFPAPFDASAVRDVWAIDEESANKLLSELVRYSLVTFDSESARYSLHDLLRDFADARLGDDERTTAQLRHAQHYLQVARLADQTYLGGKQKDGLSLFDSEWQHIKAGQAWAAENQEMNDGTAKLCSDYPDVSRYCLELRLAPGEKIVWLEIGAIAARKSNQRGSEGNHIGNLGNTYAVLGETRKAIEFYEQALAISRDIGDKRGEGNHLGNIGIAYANLGETRKAIEFHQQALAISREIGDRRAEGQDLGNLGLAYANLGDTRKAIEFYEQALAISRDIGDKRGEGNHLGNIGIAYENLGDMEKAIQFTKQALEIFVAIESPYAEQARKQLEELNRKPESGNQ